MAKDRGELLLAPKKTNGGCTLKRYICIIGGILAALVGLALVLRGFGGDQKVVAKHEEVVEVGCHSNGVMGTCKKIRECPSAIQFMYRNIPPSLCSFKENHPIICCVDLDEQEPIVNVSLMPRQQLDAESGPSYVVDQCEPIPANLTAHKTGRKAFDKCLEYQQSLVYPCQESLSPRGGMTRADFCNWKPEGLIIDGENAYSGEFPHMVLLGYGDTVVEWLCGGIITTDRFILTAAHCTISARKGPVTKVKIGIVERSEKTPTTKLYNVLKTYPHPKYRAPSIYHDIALIEVDRRMHLNRYALPACLHDGSPINDREVIVTGWGTKVFGLYALADILQKATLSKFSDEECSRCLRHIRHMPRGYDPSIQMCFGDRNNTRDSCNGDSGGPAQIRHPKLYCMYMVVGIISTGRKCGITNRPGAYTRVAPYVPWITSIVWP